MSDLNWCHCGRSTWEGDLYCSKDCLIVECGTAQTHQQTLQRPSPRLVPYKHQYPQWHEQIMKPDATRLMPNDILQVALSPSSNSSLLPPNLKTSAVSQIPNFLLSRSPADIGSPNVFSPGSPAGGSSFNTSPRNSLGDCFAALAFTRRRTLSSGSCNL